MRHGSQTVLRVAIGIPVLLGALDLTVMSAVLPVIVEELSLPVPRGVRQAAWLVAGYLLAYAVGMLGAGRLADVFGERRVLFVALGVFALGSGFVAGGGPWGSGTIRTVSYQAFEVRVSPDEALLWALILGRVVQAVAAGAIVPVGMAFGWRRFGDRKWLGFVGAIDLVGWTFGHLYGGIIVRLADWRLAFWLNLPLVLLAAVLLARFGESTVPERASFPITRFAAMATGLAMAVSGVGGSAESLTASNPWLVAAGAVLMVAGVVGRPDALVPMRLVWQRRAAFGGNVLLGICVFFVLAAVPLFVATLIETDGRQAAWLAGWLLTVFTAPLALTVWLTSRWTRRSWLLVGGLPAVAGFLLMRSWQPTAGSLVPALVVLGVSLGWWFTPLAEVPLRASPPAAAGGVSSLVLLARLVGMAIGTNLLVGVIVAAIGRVGALEGVDVQAEVLDVFRSASWLGVVAAGLLVVAGAMATRPGRPSSL